MAKLKPQSKVPSYTPKLSSVRQLPYTELQRMAETGSSSQVKAAQKEMKSRDAEQVQGEILDAIDHAVPLDAEANTMYFSSETGLFHLGTDPEKTFTTDQAKAASAKGFKVYSPSGGFYGDEPPLDAAGIDKWGKTGTSASSLSPEALAQLPGGKAKSSSGHPVDASAIQGGFKKVQKQMSRVKQLSREAQAWTGNPGDTHFTDDIVSAGDGQGTQTIRDSKGGIVRQATVSHAFDERGRLRPDALKAFEHNLESVRRDAPEAARRSAHFADRARTAPKPGGGARRKRAGSAAKKAIGAKKSASKSHGPLHGPGNVQGPAQKLTNGGTLSAGDVAKWHNNNWKKQHRNPLTGRWD